MKVYNRGSRPIVYERSFRGLKAIHPQKFVDIDEKTAKSVIEKYDDAVDEKTFRAPEPRRGRPPKEDE